MDEEQLRRLNLFVGYGDFLDAKIIFFGNEEGTAGGTPIEDAVQVRCNEYYNNGTPIKTGHVDLGYYKMFQDIGDVNEDHSTMLMYQSRLMLHFNNTEEDWFLRAAQNPELYQQIVQYKEARLYREVEASKSALVDLRPLPRSNEGVWPPYYDGAVSQDQYKRAFSYKRPYNLDHRHLLLREVRAEVIRQLILRCKNAKVLIGIGAKEEKERLFCHIFNTPGFIELEHFDGKCSYAELNLDGRPLFVFLCHFFDNRIFNLTDLRMLAQYIVNNNLI